MKTILSMLWYFGNPGKAPLDYLKDGVAHHMKKYGKGAELCLLHPADFDEIVKAMGCHNERDVRIEGVLVRPWRGMVKKHALIGMGEEYVGQEEPQETMEAV